MWEWGKANMQWWRKSWSFFSFSSPCQECWSPWPSLLSYLIWCLKQKLKAASDCPPPLISHLSLETYSEESSFLFSSFFWDSLPRPPLFNPFLKPEIRSHMTMMTMPMAEKFETPIFLKKSEKYSIVSIILIFQQRQGGRCRREGERIFLIWVRERGNYKFSVERKEAFFS